MLLMHKLSRCDWCTQGNQIYEHYHDLEWGVPCTNDQQLFEMLVLESAQAGLSWLTILKKRENYRKAFDNFDIQKVASYKKKREEALLKNEGIIRNRLKIAATVQNAQIFLEIQKECGTFSKYIWSYVSHKPIQNNHQTQSQVPSSTSLSDKISADLKRRGMRFVGTRIIYAYMQAIGLVNDHTSSCFRHSQISKRHSQISKITK